MLPGSWIYPQSMDFWGRKSSVDGSKIVEFCRFFYLCCFGLIKNEISSVQLSHVHNTQSNNHWFPVPKF